ncbi:hypothetical protein ACI65C_012109 [Semiaphis heraclei]
MTRSLFSLTVVLCLAQATTASAPPSCYRTSNYFRTHFNDTSYVLEQPAVSSAYLQVCGKSQETCCHENSEPQLVTVGRNMYDDKLQTSLKTLSGMYKEKAAKFDEYFKDMLNKARMGFHDMFKKTYGMMYEQNSYLFQDLFRDLEKYYDAGNTNIVEVLENFFSVLCQKMFTVMNSQFTFDAKYLVCVSESMSEVAPFGDVPDKLSAPLKRSFVASRTYVQALKIAGDILANINKMAPTQECLVGFTRMTQCPACRGLQDSKACNGYCLNVMKGCLAYHSQLDQDWNAFLDIMEKVKKRLLGPFNIELVVIPINVKISEGIMNFQENSQKVSQKVFANCGKPTLGPSRRRRRRRDVLYNGDDYYDYQQGRVMNDGKNKDTGEDGEDDDDDEDDEDDEYDDVKPAVPPQPRNEKKENVPEESGGRKNKQQQQPQRKNKNNNGPKNGASGGGNKNRKKNNKNNGLEDEEEDQGGPAFAFHRLLKDIGNHVSSTKNFWKRLPYEVCNNDVAVIETVQNSSCWNGSALASYGKEVMRDGIKNQKRNPEVPVDVTRPSSLLNEQVYALRALINLLKNAYQGLDVEWDMEEVFHGGESSGAGAIASSGDGSGDEDSDSSGGYMSSSPPPPPPPPVGGNGATTTATNAAGTTTPSPTRTATDPSDGGDGSGSSAGHKAKPTLQKALVTYLLPVVAVWFGGSFLEWIL